MLEEDLEFDASDNIHRARSVFGLRVTKDTEELDTSIQYTDKESTARKRSSLINYQQFSGYSEIVGHM